jgi:hypothetical protein
MSGADEVWDPTTNEVHDPRFTERNPRLDKLYEQAQLAQFSAAQLADLNRDALIYLSGHTLAPPGIEAGRWSKLSNNAVRAGAELQRRDSARGRRLTMVLSLAALTISAASLAVAISKGSGDSPPATTSPTSTPSVASTTSSTAP